MLATIVNCFIIITLLFPFMGTGEVDVDHPLTANFLEHEASIAAEKQRVTRSTDIDYSIEPNMYTTAHIHTLLFQPEVEFSPDRCLE